MSTFEDLLFWKLLNFFIVKEEYRIYSLSADHHEIWLEKKESKQYPLIRILRYDIDWGNWLSRDIMKVTAISEGIRKDIRRELDVLNIYVSQYPPVDDYEHRINEPFVHPDSEKTKVETVLVDRATAFEKFAYIEQLFSGHIGIDHIPVEPTFEEVDALKRATLKTAVERKKAEKAVFNRSKPFFTYLFIAIQLIVFAVMEFFGSTTNTETLVQFGAKFNPLILEGEWWRFFAPIFIHIGFFHLLMNTLALFYIGGEVEKIFGNMRFFVIYLLAGFAGTVASFIFSTSISAGASGAIFGCFGALLYFGYRRPGLFFRRMGWNIFIILAINLVYGFLVPGIDNAGHIGGLIGGFFAAGIVALPKKRKLFQQLVFAIATVIGLTGLLNYGFNNPLARVDEPTLLMMAQKYIDEERIDEARDLLTSSDLDFSNSAAYYFMLSYTEIMNEDYELAKESLLRAVEIRPWFPEAHYNLALVYINLGDYKEAREHVKKALDYSPRNAEYEELLEKLNEYL